MPKHRFNFVKKFKYTLIATMLVLTGTAFGIKQVQADTPGQVGNAPRCNVNAIGARSKAFSPSGSTTSVRFHVNGSKNCKVKVTANSFYAPTIGGKPYSKQSLYDRVTRVFKPGTYRMTVGLPTKSTPAKGCFYQVDITYGVKNHLPVLAYDHGKIKNCGKPKPVLSCQDLNVKHMGDRKYRFTAHADAKNTKIISYTFRFGDGKQRTVNTHRGVASTTHTYANFNHRYSGRVIVDSTRTKNVTSSRCTFHLKTPEKPKKDHKLVCQDLTATFLGVREYEFTAQARAVNTRIDSYVFHFGDGDSETVEVQNSAQTASTTHSYDQSGVTFNAFVEVNGKNKQGVTSDNCMVKVKTPPEEEKPANLVCEDLSFSAVEDQENTYDFTATASANNTTITSYDFDFGDGETQTVTVPDETAEASHTYANSDTKYVANVTVNSEDFEDVTSGSCQITIPAQIKPTPPPETPTQPSPQPEQQALPDTGFGEIANIIGFFSATSLAGGLIHHFILRRKVIA